MPNYAFNTDAEDMNEVLGISMERFAELTEANRKTYVAAFLTDKNINNNGKALEMLINEAQPTSIVEAMAIGFMFGQSREKMKGLAEKLARVI